MRISIENLLKMFLVLALSISFSGLATGHFESRKDVKRYSFTFDKYGSIKEFVESMDMFSEKFGYAFIKQKYTLNGDLYTLKITDDVFEISCSNLNFSLVMHCLESHLESVDFDTIEIEKWDFTGYLETHGFSED